MFLHNLLNVLVQIANKMGLQKNGGITEEHPGSIPGTNRKKKKFSGSGTGCTQPREYKLRSYLIEK
jgi:hypothetical protein